MIEALLMQAATRTSESVERLRGALLGCGERAFIILRALERGDEAAFSVARTNAIELDLLQEESVLPSEVECGLSDKEET